MLEHVIQSAVEGWMLVISWPNILYPIAGTLLAMMFSILPGLSGLTLMALAIPFTYAWEPLPVLLIYGAFVGGATFMGSITAILFNIPGRNSSAATMLDGYPLAQQGQSKTAIGCSAAASALGSTFGVIVLVLMIPLMRDAVLLFGPPEFLMLAVWGLMTIGVLARGSV
ncbi:MAG: tripartite tricarboxylate transporter permease, partial [Gammaproteobacteria bacterium]|nr:tripartite tricarboxylate transporter permease [Gammaproteobacteria bacterium]